MSANKKPLNAVGFSYTIQGLKPIDRYHSSTEEREELDQKLAVELTKFLIALKIHPIHMRACLAATQQFIDGNQYSLEDEFYELNPPYS